MATVSPDGKVHHQAYLYVMRPPEGERVPLPHVGAKCSCGVELYLRWTNRPLNPIDTVKKFRRAGWEMEVDRTRAPVCPTCIESRRLSRVGDKTIIAKESVVSPSSTVTPFARPAMSSPPANANAAPRLLNVDEKVSVRNLLDSHFDDKSGVYIDGYSDQRIGEECKVPWASVAALRDMAYGALKSNPEVEAIRVELLKLEPSITALNRLAQTASEKASAVKKLAEDAVKQAGEALTLAETAKASFDRMKDRLDGVLKRQGIAA